MILKKKLPKVLLFFAIFIFRGLFNLLVHIQSTFLHSCNHVTKSTQSMFLLNIMNTCHIAPIFILWL